MIFSTTQNGTNPYNIDIYRYEFKGEDYTKFFNTATNNMDTFNSAESLFSLKDYCPSYDSCYIPIQISSTNTNTVLLLPMASPFWICEFKAPKFFQNVNNTCSLPLNSNNCNNFNKNFALFKNINFLREDQNSLPITNDINNPYKESVLQTVGTIDYCQNVIIGITIEILYESDKINIKSATISYKTIVDPIIVTSDYIYNPIKVELNFMKDSKVL